MQAGKGINISARTFHLAQGDILKVNTHVNTHICGSSVTSLSGVGVSEDLQNFAHC